MMRRLVTLFAVVMVAWLFSGAALGGVRFDIGANSGRNDTGAMEWQEWTIDTGTESAQTQAGQLKVVVRAVNGKLASLLSKPELAVDARLACDGVFVEGAGAMEIRIAGLSPGAHTITTFHNSIWPGKSVGRYRVSAGGATTEVTPPRDIRYDDDTGSAHLSVVVPDDGEIAVSIESIAPGDVPYIVLNGLAIDMEDPQKQARHPSPAHRNEHADGDDGAVKLSWQPSNSAVSHRVYLAKADTYEQAIAQLSPANPDPSLLIGVVDVPSIAADVVDRASLIRYAWRVDQVDRDNKITPGRIWTFRVRHPAFPGAEGYGRFAIGGRGGRVFIVTNLNDSGPGSLREAVEANEPRTIVFEVGGLISLKRPLTIRHPYITIAGQTAPGKGICVRNYTFGGLGTHDIIMRFVRLRVGDLANSSMDGTGLASCDHSIFDHLSISWALDESISTRNARNVTIQRSIVSEALLNGPRFSGGYAGSIGGDVTSLHHNLLVHNAGRNWSLAGGLDKAGRHQGRLDIRNNVVYNWTKRTNDGGAMIVQLVNNYYKPGPATQVFHILDPERNHVFGPQDYYVAGNIMEGHVSADDDWGGIVEPKDEKLTEFVYRKPFFESYVTTLPAAEAYEDVLADVGCSVPMLDDHDRRVIHETRTGTTTYVGSLTRTPGVINSQQDSGGWEAYPEVHRPADWDTDRDGIPNEWETRHGLNPNDPSDGGSDRDGNGYTALEEYLAALARTR